MGETLWYYKITIYKIYRQGVFSFMKALTQLPPQADGRHYGIDGLRILSMFMVLLLHILAHGGILEATDYPSTRYISAYLLETASFCAVNCFGLISGYVMINAKYRYTNLVLLWLQVALFNILGTILFYFITPGSVSVLDLLFSPFPVFKRTFWYFSAYFLLFFFIPLLNHMVHGLNRRQAKVICVTIIIVFSVLPTLFNVDPFGLNNGYSTFWLLALYIIGSCIRKFNFGTNIKSIFLLCGYAISVLVSAGFFIALQFDVLSKLLIFWVKGQLINYTAPSMLFNGIALLLLFTRINISRQWIKSVIQLFSPVSFGVYILHQQPQIAAFLFRKNRFAAFADYPVPLMIGAILLSAFVLFAFFAAIDKLRLLLFQKLNLKKRLLALEEKNIGDLWPNHKTEK